MKIWILSHLKVTPGNRVLEQAARGRGHDVWLVDPVRAPIVLASAREPALPRCRGWSHQAPDLVFTRKGGPATRNRSAP